MEFGPDTCNKRASNERKPYERRPDREWGKVRRTCTYAQKACANLALFPEWSFERRRLCSLIEAKQVADACSVEGRALREDESLSQFACAVRKGDVDSVHTLHAVLVSKVVVESGVKEVRTIAVPEKAQCGTSVIAVQALPQGLQVNAGDRASLPHSRIPCDQNALSLPS